MMDKSYIIDTEMETLPEYKHSGFMSRSSTSNEVYLHESTNMTEEELDTEAIEKYSRIKIMMILDEIKYLPAFQNVEYALLSCTKNLKISPKFPKTIKRILFSTDSNNIGKLNKLAHPSGYTLDMTSPMTPIDRISYQDISNCKLIQVRRLKTIIELHDNFVRTSEGATNLPAYEIHIRAEKFAKTEWNLLVGKPIIINTIYIEKSLNKMYCPLLNLKLLEGINVMSIKNESCFFNLEYINKMPNLKRLAVNAVQYHTNFNHLKFLRSLYYPVKLLEDSKNLKVLVTKFNPLTFKSLYYAGKNLKMISMGVPRMYLNLFRNFIESPPKALLGSVIEIFPERSFAPMDLTHLKNICFMSKIKILIIKEHGKTTVIKNVCPFIDKPLKNFNNFSDIDIIVKR